MLSANLAVLVTHLPCCTPHRSQPYPAFRRYCPLFAVICCSHHPLPFPIAVQYPPELDAAVRSSQSLAAAFHHPPSFAVATVRIVHSGRLLLFIISCHSALLSTILCRWLLLSPMYRLALLPAPSGHTTRPEKTTHMHASAHNGGRRHPAYHRH